MRSWQDGKAAALVAIGLGAGALLLAGSLGRARAEPPLAPALRAPRAAAAPRSETFAVPADRPVEVVNGPPASPQAIVYLHGVCGDPLGFRSWTAAAAAHGTLVSLSGDVGCDDHPGRRKWSYDFASHHRRLQKAIAAVSRARVARGLGVALDPEHVVLIGYSQGARRAESLAERYPERYRRLGIIAIATEPLPLKLRHADAVLLMVGERDVREHIRRGRDALSHAGIRVRYLELPRAGHGEYGPDALRVMSDGLDWLFGGRPTS